MKRTQLPASTTPLQRKTPLGGGSKFGNAPKPAARKRPKDTGPSKAVVIAVLERDGYACAKCGGAAHGVRGFDYSVHHRKLRSHGVDNGLGNLVTLCGDGVRGCHGWVHANPTLARAGGWIVPGAMDPALVPIAHWENGTVYLLADGSYASRPAVAS